MRGLGRGERALMDADLFFQSLAGAGHAEDGVRSRLSWPTGRVLLSGVPSQGGASGRLPRVTDASERLVLGKGGRSYGWTLFVPDAALAGNAGYGPRLSKRCSTGSNRSRSSAVFARCSASIFLRIRLSRSTAPRTAYNEVRGAG